MMKHHILSLSLNAFTTCSTCYFVLSPVIMLSYVLILIKTLIIRIVDLRENYEVY